MFTRTQTDGGDLEMLKLELISFPDLGLQFRRPWFLRFQRLLNDLVQKVVSEHFHHRSIHRRLWQREHLMETFVRQADPQVAVGDQNALDHACKDSAQTEVFVCDLSCKLSLPLRQLSEVLVNLPDDSGTRNVIRERSVGNQIADFATQKEHSAPEHHREQCNGA